VGFVGVRLVPIIMRSSVLAIVNGGFYGVRVGAAQTVGLGGASRMRDCYGARGIR